MVISTFLDWRTGTMGLSTDSMGLLGVLTLVFGAAILVVGLAGSVAPQIRIPAQVAGLPIATVTVALAASVFLWTFGMTTAEAVKIGMHLAWIGAATAEVGGFMALKSAGHGI
jgi:hypothetical protein